MERKEHLQQRREALSPAKQALLNRLLKGKAVEQSETQRISHGRFEGNIPLSFGQKRLWFMQRLVPDSPFYNEPIGIQITGELDRDALDNSIQELIRRHEAFRTMFPLVDGEPVQKILPYTPFSLPILLAAGNTPEERESDARNLCQKLAAKPFELTEEVPLRAWLIQVEPHTHLLLFSFHHIIIDGWSMSLLFQELSHSYAALTTDKPIPGLELHFQYKDYVMWQKEQLKGEVLEQQLAYWKEQLRDCPPLNLPTDHPRRAEQSYQGETCSLTLPAELVRALHDVAREHDLTLYMVLLSAFAVLLHRYTGDEDIAIGTPIAGRTRPEWEQLMGFFANTLVIRADLSDKPDFRELFHRMKKVMLEAWQNQDVPFEKLIEELNVQRDRSRSPLFQVMFAMQNSPTPDVQLENLQLSTFTVDKKTAKFDLWLSLTETEDGVTGVLEYASDLFERQTIVRMIQHYVRILEQMAAQPQTSLGDFPLLSVQEEELILKDWNDTNVLFEEDGWVHQLIERQAALFPSRIALYFGENALTYEEVNQRSNQLAHYLQAQGVGPDVLVGICMHRSVEMVVSLLAVLKAGGAYVPIDPSYPRERIAYVLSDAQTPLLLTQEELTQELLSCDLRNTKLVIVDGAITEWATESCQNLNDHATGEQLAYVIYTSGSTGMPKGVMNTQQGLRNRLLWMQREYALRADDVVIQKTPYSFDVSVWEFFWPLLAGVSLVIAQPDGHKDPAYLIRLIQDRQVTTIHFVPSMLQLFLEAEGVESCSSLRRVFCSGEALPPELKERFFTKLRQTELYNLYGPTEAAIDVTAQACRPGPEKGSVSIGRPIANTRIYIVDRYLHPLPIGVPGEICIGGVQVARGYWNLPERTADVFLPDPFSDQVDARLYRTGDRGRWLPDGSIEYLGRYDFQVKLRGQRIELGEIEHTLTQLETVREAVVVLKKVRQIEQLIAYIVPFDGQEIDRVAVLRHLHDRLPTYMVPAHIMVLQDLPLSPNGKVNRNQLPEPDEDVRDTPYESPRNQLEKSLTRIWQEVLQVDSIGIHDNYYQLGGDSIQSIRIQAYAQKEGLFFSLQQMLQSQTIAGLAEKMAEGTKDADQTERVTKTSAFERIPSELRNRFPHNAVDAYPLASLQAGMLFHSVWNKHDATFHDVFQFRLHYDFDQTLLERALHLLQDRHPVLRTSFDFVRFEQPLQVVYSSVPATIEVADLRGLSHADQQKRLEEWSQKEKKKGFDWEQAPLFRVTVHLLGERDFVLALCFHHAIMDGWSVASLLTEWFHTYSSLLQGRVVNETQLQSVYRDFVAIEQKAKESADARAYWDRLLNELSVTLLPGVNPVESREGSTQVIGQKLPKKLAARLIRLGKKHGYPLRTLLLAAHLRVLSHLSGQTDVLTGVLTNGRLAEEDGDRVLGVFLNTLPFRKNLDGGTWTELWQAIADREHEMHPYRRFPAAEIRRLHGGAPLYSTLFNFNHFHIYRNWKDDDQLQIVHAETFEQTDIPVFVQFTQDAFDAEEIEMKIMFDDVRCDPSAMERLEEALLRVLQSMAKNPHADYRMSDFLSEEERNRILIEWNETARVWPDKQSIHQLWEEQAARMPEAIALTESGSHFTFDLVNKRSNQLAHLLRKQGVGPGSFVGVYMSRSADTVIALIAILKAGGAYVPLDPAYPQERISYMLDDAKIELLITTNQWAQTLSHREVRLLRIDGDATSIQAMPQENPLHATTSEQAAHLLYTSGSTGQPKGVVGTHGNTLNRCFWMWETYPFAAGEICCHKTSLNFVDSIWEIFGPLLQGVTLAIVDDETVKDPSALLADLRKNRVSRIVLVPSLLRVILDELERTGSTWETLRICTTSGEALTTSLAEQFARIQPHSVLLNLYGSSEVSADVTFYELPRTGSGQPVLIGKPIANTRIYILDSRRMPVPVGVPGEIHVGGAMVTKGYINKPELTAERFIPDPFLGEEGALLFRTGDLGCYQHDGAILYLGRVDHQIKLRGYRIEPGEIEAAILAHPDVLETVVLPDQTEEDRLQLVAYVVPAHSLDVKDLRLHLHTHLPSYMVPGQYVFLDHLPLTPNGKLDRKRLPLPDREQSDQETDFVAPRTELESELLTIWQSVLGRQSIGIQDDFFRIGGDSLIATSLVSRIRSIWDVEIALRDFFAQPTIEGVASLLEIALLEGTDPAWFEELIAATEPSKNS